MDKAYLEKKGRRKWQKDDWIIIWQLLKKYWFPF